MFTALPLVWLPLADAVVKATVILAAAAAAALALRRASAAVRHLVWTLALGGVLLLPLISVTLPKWQLPLLSIGASQAAPAAAAGTSAGRAPALNRLADETGRAATASPAPALPRRDGASGTVPTSWLPRVTLQQALLTIWSAGVIVVLLRMALGLLAVRWLAIRTPPIAAAPWLPMARGLAHDLGITAKLRFLRSGRASMPIAAGIFTPTVIMPLDADEWSSARLRVVLLHELAHVKRRDCLTHLLAQTACAAYWFNPLAWMAARRVRTERERACDDLVLASGTRGSDYADQLLAIASSMRGDRFPTLFAGASLAMAHRSQLEGRLIAILDPQVPRAGVSRSFACVAAALCCLTITPLGALQPWAAADRPAAGRGSTPALGGAADVVAGGAANAVSNHSAIAHSLLAPTSPAPGGLVPGAPTPDAAPSQAPRAGDTPATASAPVGDAVVPPVIAAIVAEWLPSAAIADAADAIAEALQTITPTPAPEPRITRTAKPADARMVAALTAALKDTDKDVREAALHALVQMRDPSVFEPLVQALKDPSADVREQAASGLGQLADRRAVSALVALLKDENAAVREQVVFALGQLRDGAAVEGLGAALGDSLPGVREQAAFALGQIRDRRAVEPLISALKDASADVREQAAFALGQLRDRGGVEALIVATRDLNPDVREQVVFALGQIRDPRALEALTTALADQVASVRQHAAFALGQLAR